MADAGNEKLTPLEREIIEKANVDVDNPPDLSSTQLGKELTEQYTKARVRTDEEDVQAAAVAPEVVDLDALDPDKRAEIISAITSAHNQEEQAKQQKAKSDAIPDYIKTTPGLAAAYTVAADNAPPVIVDDLDEEDEEEEVEPVATEQPPVPTAEKEEQKPVSGAAIKQAKCPKCNHQLDQPVIEVSDEDKYAFIAATIGGQRFTKEYRFFDGNIRAVFRELTPKEANFALKQLDIDNKNGDIVGEYDYFRKLVDYRLVMSLSLFQRTDKAPVELAEVSTLKYDKTKEETPIPGLAQFVENDIFITEHVRRTVGVSFMRFQRLVEILEARSEDAGFFTMTESQP